MNLLAFWLRGLALGISAGTSPGPLQTYLINESLRGGWRRALPVLLAPLVGDIPIVLLIMLVLKQVPLESLHWLNLAGGLYVLYLGYRLFHQWQAKDGITRQATEGRIRSLRQAILVIWLNPNPYLYWALVNGPLLRQALEQSILHGLIFLAAFYGVFAAALLIIAIIFDLARRLGPRLVRSLRLISILVLVGFGFFLLSSFFSSAGS